jgi:hypothetical protein
MAEAGDEVIPGSIYSGQIVTRNSRRCHENGGSMSLIPSIALTYVLRITLIPPLINIPSITKMMLHRPPMTVPSLSESNSFSGRTWRVLYIDYHLVYTMSEIVADARFVIAGWSLYSRTSAYNLAMVGSYMKQ